MGGAHSPPPGVNFSLCPLFTFPGFRHEGHSLRSLFRAAEAGQPAGSHAGAAWGGG